MCREWLRRQMHFYYGNDKGEDYKLFSFLGGWEIALIVAAIIIIFGVGKLGNVGGALGKSIREFRKEKDKIDDVPQLNTKEKQEEKTESQSKD